MKAKELNDLNSRLKFTEKKCVDLKGILDKRKEELNLAHDKVSESQIRFFTVQQEFEIYRERADREIGQLQSSLRSINEQNIALIQERLDKEEEFKKSKSTLITEISNISSELKEYKLTFNGLHSNNLIDADKVEFLRKEVKDNVKSEIDDIQKLTLENINLKNELSIKKKQLFALFSKHEGMVKTFNDDLQTVKSNYHRLDHQCKAAYENFKIKEDELSKMKDELKLMTIEKITVEEELNQ